MAWRQLLAVLSLIGTLQALPKTDLFPFGREQYLPTGDDVSSPEIELAVPVVFYGTEYRSVYVNDNGLISFLTEVPSFFNAQFPLTYPIIAPFYSDVDTRSSGRIYYRETQSAELLERATKDIRNHFSSAGAFQARSLFIVTWDEVGHYDRSTEKVNTFQTVLVSNGDDTFAYFLYPSGGMQWIQGQGKNPNLPDARAQAGFMSGDGRLYTLRGSGTEQARNFDRMSNTRQAGIWMFHIGRPLGSEGNVMPADLELTPDTERTDGQASATCADTLLPCPQHSLCVDQTDGKGLCCVCKEGYFGNGRNCVERNSPQRMNGKVSGFINDIKLDEVDLHAYIVTEDGRTYTAVSRVPHAVGTDLQVLTPLGGVIGWLFAVSRNDAPNGFTITGGHFNRTVEVDYPQTGHHVFIEESFLGPDVFNYMRVHVKLRGTVPSVPLGSKIEVDDYEEEFTRVSPGVIRSHSSRSYRLEGNSLEVPFTLDQTISYTECIAPMSSTRLKVARNFIVYDSNEQIVRYAMTNKVSPLAVDDTCKDGRHQCPPNSNCMVGGDSYVCACIQGYQYIYEEDNSGERATCADINECALGRDNCHVFADCVNLPGSFGCRCQSGYKGDGVNCERKQSCADLICDVQAECVERGPRDAPQCRCRAGYVGDGVAACRPADSDDCRQTNYCDPRAECVYNDGAQRHECRCRSGYTGDGIVCVEVSCDVASNCSPDGDCLYDDEGQAFYCACRPGFSGDGYACRPEADIGGARCDGRCHPAAECIQDPASQRPRCACVDGYRGDGYSCVREEEVTCDRAEVCSRHGVCVRDEYAGKYVCRCGEGYEGDGIVCEPATDECNTAADCHQEAQCLYEPAEQRYRCRCIPGHSGDGRRACAPDAEVPCDVRNTCDPNSADCVFDHLEQRHRCRCRSGFQGDGVTCERRGCDVINDCHVRAECELDGARGYRCRCLAGYEGDGRQCRPVRSCREDRYLCNDNADCLPNDETGEYLCRCRQGYIGDGISCTAAPQHSGGQLVFAHGMSLLKVPTTPTKSDPGQLLLMEPNQTPVGLAADCRMGHLYWADASLKVIRRANYNGSDVTVVISTDDMLSPEGVAVDWLSRTIFWTDSGKDTIEVAGLTTKAYRKVLISEGLDNPRGIAVHPGLGKIFWSDWRRSSPKIEVANMDGTGRADLVADNLKLPNMIVVDFERNNLCWTDSGLGRIECIGVNGQGRRLVYTPAAYPFGIAVHGGYIYWTDWEIKFLHRVDVNGGEAEPLEVPAGGSGRMYGLVSLPSFCPPVGSPCAIENGGCRYLCLPDGRGSRTCICPDSSDDEEETIDCNRGV